MPGRDPFGSMQGFMGQFQNFMGNPMQYMMQKKLNLPQGINPMQNPQAAIQHLMNNGMMSQQQYNQLQQMAGQIQQNPQFEQFAHQMMNGQNGQK